MYLKNHSPSLLLPHLSLLVHPLRFRLRFRSIFLQIRFLLYVVLNCLFFFFLSNSTIWSGSNSCTGTRCCGPTSANSCSPKTSINFEDNCKFLLCTSFNPLSSYSSTLKTSSSGGFAAFAGSSSLFTSNNPQQSTSNSSRPIWTTSKSERTFDHKNELENSESSSSIEAFFKPAKDIGTSEVTLATSKYTR